MTRIWLTLMSTLGVCALLTPNASAQSIITGPIGNELRPGASAPFDGLPYSIRYGYYPAVSYYSGMSRQKFEYLEYLDRVERAKKFGYDMPKPYIPSTPVPRTKKRGRFGFGFLFGR